MLVAVRASLFVLAAVGRTMNSSLTSVDVATTGRWQQMQ
jgi:hypothetical protein